MLYVQIRVCMYPESECAELEWHCIFVAMNMYTVSQQRNFDITSSSSDFWDEMVYWKREGDREREREGEGRKHV